MENYTGPKYGKIGAKSPVDLRCYLRLRAAIKEREYFTYVVLPSCWALSRNRGV